MGSPVLILFVDDEELIFETARESLEDGGFEVRGAHSAQEAMTELDRSSDELSAVVTDVNLGSKITGWDIAKRARELRPEIPVVYTSGFAADDWSSMGVPHSLMIPKPYAPAQIVTAISSLMNKAASQPKGSG